MIMYHKDVRCLLRMKALVFIITIRRTYVVISMSTKILCCILSEKFASNCAPSTKIPYNEAKEVRETNSTEVGGRKIALQRCGGGGG